MSRRSRRPWIGSEPTKPDTGVSYGDAEPENILPAPFGPDRVSGRDMSSSPSWPHLVGIAAVNNSNRARGLPSHGSSTVFTLLLSQLAAIESTQRADALRAL
jgi:hypothetical protein